MAEEEKQETLQVSKKQAAQLGGAGPARTVEQRTSTQILLAPNAGGAEVNIRGAPAGVAKALTMLKVLVAFKEAASPEERGLCHWFACGFCRDGEDEDGCEAGLHSATLSAETQAAWLGKAPKDAKVKARPLLLAISCGGVGPPLPAPGQLSAPRTGGGIGCPEEDLIELCLVAMDWEDAAEVSRFHRFVRPNAWDQQDAEMRTAHQAECFAEKPPAIHFTDVLADLLDWLPRLVGVSLDEMRPEDLLFISPRDWEVQCLLPRRCAASGSVDYELQDFFFNRWCCLKDVFREHFALPNEAAPTGLGAMARYLGLPPGDKIRRTKCLDENALVVRVVMELLKKGWKPKATAWRGNVQGHTTFLLPRRGDLPAAGYDENSRKRGFWEMQGSPPPPPAPEAAPPPILGPIVGATAKVAPKPPWQRSEQPMPPWVLALVPGFRHSRAPVSARRAAADLLESKGLEEMMTYRQMRERRRREASRTWRKESADWSDEEDSDSDFIANLKHGTNLLLNGAKEFPPWKDVRAEHAERGHKWMEKFSIEEIWAQHCVVPYVANDWRSVLDPLERIVDKADMAYAAVRHVKDVLDPSVKFRRAHRFAAQARWAIERRLRRCDRFSRAFLGLLGADENATEGQRRAAALLMILFEQDGVNLQHNGIYRDDPDAFLELQKVRGAVFNISLIWDQNVDRDMESRAYLIRSREELEGLPQWVLEDAAAMARAAGYRATGAEGPWLISTHEAQAGPVLRHGSAALRAVVFENQRRIGFLGGAGKGDNTPMLEQLLQVRRRLANVVGYTSHAEVVFTKTMASPKQAYGLLAKLRKEALPVARYELQELKAFAEAHGGERVASTADLEHFDLDFWRERMLEERLGLKEDYLRQFFPLDAVLEGLFGLVSRLFGVQVVEESSELCWAQGVRFFRVQDAVGARVASFFLDPFRRPGQKRRGFWSSKIQGYSELLGDRHGPRRPAVHFVFDLPEAPALLTHREVVQVFRTFGSGLRELFCRQREGLVAGSLGLEEDVLELPSHFLARWAFEPETLAACSRHVETKDPLPPAALQALAASRTFHRANALLRRCALARIDLEIHSDYDPYSDLQVFDIGKLIEAEYSVVRPRTQDRELCSLPFNTEKAGVFYGDLWSEALAADVFRTFQDAAASGSPDALGEVGARFRREVLAPGGGRAPGSALEAFLGRPPEFAALLRDLHLVDSELREKADAEVEAEVEDNQREAISFEEAYPQFEQDEDEDDYAEFEEE